ncbi:MAG TPA: ATP-binding protein [Trebonia sp.]|nr:ATP-binding protein [Trebonia sp.]
MSHLVRTQRATQPDVRFCLVFGRDRTSVSAMRQVLGDTLRRLGVDEDSVADILLAASEACTNVIQHAARSVGDYTVTTTVESARCRVEIIDSGQVRRVPARQRVAAMSESGRGFEVMRACVDDVRLRSSPGRGTIVTLDKVLSTR